MAASDRRSDWLHRGWHPGWTCNTKHGSLDALPPGRPGRVARIGQLCIRGIICEPVTFRFTAITTGHWANRYGRRHPGTYCWYCPGRTAANTCALVLGYRISSGACSGRHVARLYLLLLAYRAGWADTHAHSYLSSSLYGAGLWCATAPRASGVERHWRPGSRAHWHFRDGQEDGAEKSILERLRYSLLIEFSTCNRTTGAGCTLIPTTDDNTPADFYPFFSITGKGNQGQGWECMWQIGNDTPATANDFGRRAAS